jgi:hypothetical protein
MPNEDVIVTLASRGLVAFFSNEDVIITLASLGVVAFLSLMAFLMGFRTGTRIDGLDALLAESEPGAAISEGVVDARGKAAVARLADGRIFVARVIGDRISVRTLPARAVRARLGPNKAVLSFADLGFPRLRLRLGEERAPAWLAALGAGEQS